MSEDIRSKCKDMTTRFMPSDKYDILDVFAPPWTCVVDFKRKGFEANLDCDEYCETIVSDFFATEGSLQQCVEECNSKKESAERGSIQFWADDGSIREATIPGNCSLHWFEEAPGEEIGKIQERRKNLGFKLNRLGCKFDSSHIHPHEIAGGAEWEEYPAVCYYHPSASEKGKCNMDKVLSILEKFI